MYIQEKSIISHKNIGIYSLSKVVTKVVMITLPWNYTAQINGKMILIVQSSRINKGKKFR